MKKCLYNSDISERIISNLDLAEKIAKCKKRKLSHVAYDELKSAAYFGLVEAANRFNPDKNDNFRAYAVCRISGSIQDYLRELSWGSRNKPLKMAEVFVYENTTYEECNMNFFDDIIQSLPATNKIILKLYYVEGMKIKEIAFDMGVHQSRISQILSESRSKLFDNLDLLAA